MMETDGLPVYKMPLSNKEIMAIYKEIDKEPDSEVRQRRERDLARQLIKYVLSDIKE